jgi:hypothetical protein
MWPAAGLAALIALASCSGSAGESDCERAVARMKRLDARGHRPALTAPMAKRIVAQCQKGGTGSYDAVLECAREQPSDADAQRCIDAFLDDVLRPAPSQPEEPAGRGLNPLLDR